MYSRKLSNPLYSKVEAIVAQKAVYGSIKHSDFDCIRNKSSVRAILIGMGYMPCNYAKPCIWKTSKRESLSNEMKTRTGQNILDELKAKGEYQPSSFPMSRKYLENIMGDIRKLGYQIVSVKSGTKTMVYKLNKQ